MKNCIYRPDMRQFIFAIIYLLFMALLTVSFIQVTDVDVKDFFASSNIMVREIQIDEMVRKFSGRYLQNTPKPCSVKIF